MSSNGNGTAFEAQKSTWRTKVGLAEMLKGGVIMDVATVDQAVIAEEAGAVAVMALERIPADIRAMGGVARMSNLELVQSIMDAVTIPVMAKVRIGHFAEAQALQELGIDFIDESEVLTPAAPSTGVSSVSMLVVRRDCPPGEAIPLIERFLRGEMP